MKSLTHIMGTLVLLHLPIHAQNEPTPIADVPLPSQIAASSSGITRLVAMIYPVGSGTVKGSVVFQKTADGIMVTAKIGGLKPESTHGFHIHEFGDLGSADGSSAGDHFNPSGHDHALPDAPQRHAGDMGNLHADASGNAGLTILLKGITLEGGRDGILGRSVIVHEKADDGGQPSGNAGARIGGGVIGISKDTKADTITVPAPSEPGEDATR